MFHVVDRGKIMYSGELSQVTQYILDNHDKSIGKAIRSGIRITYGNALRSINEPCCTHKQSQITALHRL